MDVSYGEWQHLVDHAEDVPDQVFAYALNSEDPLVVWAGLRGSGLKKTNSGHLIRLLKSSRPVLNEDMVRRQLAWALAQSVSDLQLAQFEPSDMSTRVQGSAAFREVLADFVGEAALSNGIPLLAKLLLDDLDSVASWAALSLAKIGSASLPQLEELARSKSLSPKRLIYVLDCLGKIGTPEARNLGQNLCKENGLEEYRSLLSSDRKL